MTRSTTTLLPGACAIRQKWLRLPAADFFFSGWKPLPHFRPMPEPLLNRHASVRQGAYLPHWTAEHAIYHVVFRLADSLPADVVERYREERTMLLAETNGTPTVVTQARLNELFSSKIEQHLDTGHGSCWLARSNVADLVASALSHFDRTRYHLHAWCVMPNHVHAVVQPAGTETLSSILHSWKSFTATHTNRLLQRTGAFWQKESYDHIVRDATDLDRTIRYVCENPLKAGLANWKWVRP